MGRYARSGQRRARSQMFMPGICTLDIEFGTSGYQIHRQVVPVAFSIAHGDNPRYGHSLTGDLVQALGSGAARYDIADSGLAIYGADTNLIQCNVGANAADTDSYWQIIGGGTLTWDTAYNEKLYDDAALQLQGTGAPGDRSYVPQAALTLEGYYLLIYVIGVAGSEPEDPTALVRPCCWNGDFSSDLMQDEGAGTAHWRKLRTLDSIHYYEVWQRTPNLGSGDYYPGYLMPYSPTNNYRRVAALTMYQAGDVDMGSGKYQGDFEARGVIPRPDTDAVTTSREIGLLTPSAGTRWLIPSAYAWSVAVKYRRLLYTADWVDLGSLQDHMWIQWGAWLVFYSGIQEESGPERMTAAIRYARPPGSPYGVNVTEADYAPPSTPASRWVGVTGGPGRKLKVWIKDTRVELFVGTPEQTGTSDQDSDVKDFTNAIALGAAMEVDSATLAWADNEANVSRSCNGMIERVQLYSHVIGGA